jgi:DNA-directed RNA polymerase subunit E'/Rpb7
MDGLAVCSLKSAVVDAGLVSYADFAPGSIVTGSVENVEDFGMFVKLAPGVKCAHSPALLFPHTVSQYAHNVGKHCRQS